MGKICLDVLSKLSSSLFSLDIPYSRGASEVRSLECSGKRTPEFRRKKEKKDSLPTGEISNRDLFAIFIKGVDFFSHEF